MDLLARTWIKEEQHEFGVRGSTADKGTAWKPPELSFLVHLMEIQYSELQGDGSRGWF